MSEPLLTKRLHISGLTPSITPADLERRLSSFGKVKAMDGFGARDAIGDPRKFGYVTMEIGAKELAKCESRFLLHVPILLDALEQDSYSSEIGLNVLSGSTWKGAKLRIGDAKPDFRERCACFLDRPCARSNNVTTPDSPKSTPSHRGPFDRSERVPVTMAILHPLFR